ncbi:MAG: hypothetical protein HQM11_04825 [SAR324 cluster bacterium]|nr:hypothetical protein [SAR324 cluster bacterium]
MKFRDLYLDNSDSSRKVFEFLVEVLSTSGKPVQTGQSIDSHPCYYIVQPEELLLKVTQNQETPAGGAIQIRIQPYNLPDPDDQVALLREISEKLIHHIEQHAPAWRYYLSDIQES